jgi:hypothetical protein
MIARGSFYCGGLQLPICGCVLCAMPFPPWTPRPTSRPYAPSSERGSRVPRAPRASARTGWGARGQGMRQKEVSFSLAEWAGWGRRDAAAGLRSTADQFRPGARTARRGPRTRLSLQALRTLPNSSATAKTATPLTTLLPSQPVASMTSSAHAERPHPLTSPWFVRSAPRSLAG